MTMLLQEITDKALNLPLEERAELALKLIESLEDIEKEEVETAWKIEIEKRVDEIKSGTAKGRPAEDVLAEIRAAYS